MSREDIDRHVRLRAFEFLAGQTQRHGEVLPRETLAAGFTVEGRRVPLIGPQGIFKPAILPDLPLSITTVPVLEGRDPPYDDALGPEGLLRYRYRGTDPEHRDNVGLRLAMERRVPLIYFYGVVPGQYMAVWPVYVVADHREQLSFSVAVDEPRFVSGPLSGADLHAEGRRAYLTVTTQRRLHQQGFRHRVLRAYEERCAICRLRRRELVDAAHILPDGHPQGEPIVPNGLALCALHHLAFDRHVLGIRPDLTVELSLDLLRETDGPMLQHGLLGFNGARIVVPRSPPLRPHPDFLAERYEMFRQAS